MLNRLPTLDRLAAWGFNVVGACKLCLADMETHDHLFFGCNFSREVWQAILQLCELRRAVLGWSAELNWAVKKLKGRSLIAIILRAAWRAYVYFIWREKNQRLYNQ